LLVALATSQTPAQIPADERALSHSLAEVGISARLEIWSSSKADWSEFDAVVVRSCWDYHLRLDHFRRWLDRLQRQNIRVLNSPDLIRWNIDKRYLLELQDLGVSIPDTIWLEDGEHIDIGATCRSRSWPSAIVKPLVSASAYGLRRRSDGIVEGPGIMQEFLPEIESAGEWSLVYFEGKFSHAVRKRAASGDFRVQSDFGGTAELAAPRPCLRDIADKAITVLPSRPVFARVDMVERGASALLMELETIEPELFIALDPAASSRLARAIRDAVLK
jgi:glutathione synthase/RimK-type ligase-like ATP-grasp enzyme